MEFLQQLSVPSTLIYGIAIAGILVYLPFLLVAAGRLQAGYDRAAMAAPRAMFDKLPGYAQRATWAHQNSFESFALFTAAALMAYVTGVEAPIAATAVLVYIVARLLYSVFYIANAPILRSLMFATGSLCIGTLVVLALLRTSS
ncbi:MAPEG family protein [Thermocoleostomius sinensis]|uniref:MAPEG family protein n=1 Tax=Thermocoleostomius sinensis A174 TaxID=2016057 RepID=A0A9E8Z917_9CYAN|nr:MAPEG family protein [Thermocoleostomius sinensis]WAL58753.1 MAPEG family protein [Thermocoleostomius sinensis A174]